MYKLDPSIVAKDPLLQPLTIKHVTFRNRIMSTSHACGLEVNGMPDEAYQTYHEEKAKGGLGLSMFGGSSNVDIDSPNVFRQLNVSTDAIIPYMQKFSTRMHKHGAGIMCQISHLGRRGDSYSGPYLPMIAPSAIRETAHRSIPKEMDEYDIDRVVNAYAQAARRCKEGGLDGIETLASGHLIGQFFSPYMNRRTDRFGGSLENRCRFALMVHEAIRKAVGDKFLVGMRIGVDDGPSGPLQLDECIRIGLILKEAGAVDFFNANYGVMETVPSLARYSMPGMGTPLAPWVETVGAFREAVGIPVFHATRIADLSSARYAVREGKLDMAGMTRAQIADPYIVTKLASGRETEIRPCVGATHCQSPQRPSCLHNPVTGRELTLKHIIPKTQGPVRKVVIIGGGPAGLEAARVSAERGHKVSLYEAASDFGGQILIGATGSWRRDLMGIVEWRVAELQRLGVDLHTNAYMDEEDILSLEPDVVIIATGGQPQTDLAEGADLSTSAWDVLTGQATLAGDVLVFDGTGRHPGPLAAERAAEAGARVHYVSIDAILAEDLTYAERFRWKQLFLKHKIQPVPETRLISLKRHDNRLLATLANDVSLELSTIVVDHAVVEQGTIPMSEVYDRIRARAKNKGVTDLPALVEAKPQPHSDGEGMVVHRIGDAVSSRNIHSAMLDALRLCTAL